MLDYLSPHYTCYVWFDPLRTKMVQLQLNQTIHIVGLFMYIAFLCLGIYFIYEGNVVQRFQMKRTNFAESNERINELPTILAEIEYKYPYPDTLMIYGTDFNIALLPNQSASSSCDS